jgi:hypothetical protein
MRVGNFTGWLAVFKTGSRHSCRVDFEAGIHPGTWIGSRLILAQAIKLTLARHFNGSPMTAQVLLNTVTISWK